MSLIFPARRRLTLTSLEDPFPYYFRFPYSFAYRRRLSLALKMLGRAKYGSLLEVGTGCGIFLASLSRRTVRLAAVDIHPCLADVARMVRAEGFEAGLVQADVCDLPFADDSFDCVVCISMLEFLPDPARAVREMFRVCRPGGAVVAGFPVINPLTAMLYEAMGNRRHKSVHRCSHRDIINAFRGAGCETRVVRFPAWFSLDNALFACIRATVSKKERLT